MESSFFRLQLYDVSISPVINRNNSIQVIQYIRKYNLFDELWSLTTVSPRQFQKGAAPCLPFHRMNSVLVAFRSKIVPFLSFSKKREKGCLFIIFIYILNMSYTFKLKSVFGNQKCVLKNIKSALFLFSAPCPFFSLRETLIFIFNYSDILK